jgi:dihydrofolate reductase
MGILRYGAITSGDGFVNDAQGSYAWATPDEALHAYINQAEQDTTLFLMGRRLYEEMCAWEGLDARDDLDPVEMDFARLWAGADKVVYSTTLTEPRTARTRIETHVDPTTMRALVAGSAGVVGIGGPTLAEQAFRAGLVDEVHLYVLPIDVGAGTPALTEESAAALEVVAEHPLASGVVHRILRPRTAHASPR